MLKTVAMSAVKAVAVFFILVSLIYALLILMPGGPLADKLHLIQDPKQRMSDRDLENTARLLGADLPEPVRYVAWLAGDDWIGVLNPAWEGERRGVLRGDFGDSWMQRRPAGAVVREAIPVTASLIIAAALLGLVAAVTVGGLAAARTGPRADAVLRMAGAGALAVPTYVLELGLIVLLSTQFKVWNLPYFPDGGSASLRQPREGSLLHPLGAEPGSFLDQAVHLAVPAMVLALPFAIGWSGLVYRRLRELRFGDARIARADESTSSRSVLAHVALPLLALTAFQLPALLSFSMPMGFMATTQGTRRIGALALNAVSYADWPVFQGVLLVGAAVLVLAIFARDVLLAVSARIAAGSSPANVVSTEAAVPFVGDPVLNLGRLDLSPVPGGSTGVWERFRRQRIGWLGLGLIAVLLLITLLGPIVSPYSATEIPMNVPYDVLTNRGPFSTIVDEAGEAHFHVLGTDRSGRDKATRMLVAGRQALLLALAAAGLCTALGVLVGAVGARLGGITNRVIAAVTDLVAASAGPFYAFPLVVATLYLAGAGSAFRGASGFLAALLLCGWVGAAAHTRDWLTATRVSQDDPAPVLGAGNPPSRAAADARPMNGETARTGLHRLLPALAANAAFIASWVIIADVFFAFVGYGVIGAAVVPDPSWGNMLRDAQGMMFTAPWVVFLPLAALILTCLPFNLVGMALRRALDPTWAS